MVRPGCSQTYICVSFGCLMYSSSSLAFWLRSCVVSVLISLTTYMGPLDPFWFPSFCLARQRCPLLARLADTMTSALHYSLVLSGTPHVVLSCLLSSGRHGRDEMACFPISTDGSPSRAPNNLRHCLHGGQSSLPANLFDALVSM
jgi:hypothetical protein